MKTILFDSQIFDSQEYGGISRYFAELISGISLSGEFRVLPKRFYSRNKYLFDKKLTSLDRFRLLKSFRGKYRIERSIKKVETTRILSKLKEGRFDVFHPTYYNSYFIDYVSKIKPFVLTVHDMIHEQYYDPMFNRTHNESLYKSILIPKANHIIAVSHFTKQKILHYYPMVDPNKISVIYHGVSLECSPDNFNIDNSKRYILFVGLRKHYKNFKWLVASLASYLKDNRLTLISAGGPGFEADEFRLLESLGLKNHVFHKEIDNEQELSFVYRNALCLIFPSSIEGFGLPIIEAFKCMCPVILSNTSSFPEIGADSALFFEEKNEEDLIKKIDQLLTNEPLRYSLIEKGLVSARSFTWSSCISAHIKVYESLIF